MPFHYLVFAEYHDEIIDPFSLKPPVSNNAPVLVRVISIAQTIYDLLLCGFPILDKFVFFSGDFSSIYYLSLRSARNYRGSEEEGKR